MREILFRGRNIKGSQFIYGDLRQDRDLGTTYISEYNYYGDIIIMEVMNEYCPESCFKQVK